MESPQDNDLKLKCAELEGELAKRDREIEIEAALDRVRRVAMGMRKRDDLLDICRALFAELQLLDFNDLRNAIIHTYLHANYLTDYDYSDFTQGHISHIPYSDNPIAEKYANDIRKTKDAFAELIITGSKFKQWKAFMDANNEAPDERLGNATSLYYYIYAVGEASIGISTFSPIQAEKLAVLKRFRNVFDLAYSRFMDINQAEAQAREAKIEAALERVRTVAMGMRKRDDLLDICKAMYEELQTLGFAELRNAMINILHDDQGFFLDYDFNDTTGATVTKFMYDSSPMMEQQVEITRSGSDAFIEHILTGADLEEFKAFRIQNGEEPDPRLENILGLYYYFYSIGIGSVGISVFGSLAEENREILKRFRNVFDLAYRRYADIELAGAQAREAKIETALERVRSRSMGMQKSNELKEVIQIVYEQFVHLDISIDHTGFVVDYKARGDWHFWVADQLGSPAKLTVANYDCEWNNRFDEAKEKGIDFFVTKLDFEEKNKFYRDLFDHAPAIPEQEKELIFNKPALAISTVLLEDVALYIENYAGTPYTDEENATLMRFGKVFQQTYTRFLDLQKAEAQAREGQIQLALERVRARSMAMQRSEELQEVIQVVFDQLQLLNFNLDVANFALNYKETDDFDLWIASAGAQYATRIYIPYFNHPIFDHFNKAKIQSGLFTDTLSYEEKNSFFEHFFKHSPEVSAERKALVFEQPGFARSVAIMKNTVLSVINYEGITYLEDENDILLRFGQVFDQTYTRFSDLKQAEEQAREGQIQLALERVRARTMAMQKSGELAIVIQSIYDQLVYLGLDVITAGFIMDYKKRADMGMWVANQGQQDANKVNIPYYDGPIYNLFYEAIEKGIDFYPVVLNKEEKDIHYGHVFQHTSPVPNEVKEMVYSMPGYADSHVLLKDVVLFISNLTGIPYSDEENTILMRFGKVFEQTYTRFSDLKKAEEQGRESQIQLALERIRARTMAMQHSDELSETAAVLFRQCKELGEDPIQITIGIINESEGNIEFSATDQVGNKIERVVRMSTDEPNLLNKLYAAWKEKKRSTALELSGKELMGWVSYRSELTGIPDNNDYSGSRRSVIAAFFSKGLISLSTPEPRPLEVIQLLERFAGVFDGTYTRFLDLKQAEAQVRESQIQLALERIRARTMAMQKSDELAETVFIIFQQFKELGENPDQATIGIVNEQEKVIEYWVTMHGEQTNRVFKFSIDEPEVTRKIYDGWKEQKKSIVIDLSGKALHDFTTYRASLGGAPAKKGEKRRIINVAFFSKGIINVQSNDERSEESTRLLERFAGVFEGTYTRFLDLQKAEAQAREAQIELGLERVRARAMAMQTSDELADLVATVLGELKRLDFALSWCLVTLVDYEAWACRVWMANANVDQLPQSFHLPFTDLPFQKAIMQAWKERKSKWVYELKGADKKATDEYMFTKTDYRKLPKAAQDSIRSLDPAFFSFSFSNFGGLQTGGPQPLSEANLDILSRFGKVFDLTYTRFNDLQKAEAQVREAQIEAALERVRSKTMAMHSSSDVAYTTAVMFDELIRLGVEKMVRCGIVILTRGSWQMEIWTAKADENEKPELIIGHFDMNVHPMLRGIYDAWHKHESGFSYILTGDDLVNYFEVINDLPDYPIKYDISKLPSRQYQNDFFFAEGLLFAFTSQPLSDEISSVFKRFAGVFGQTYRRYLDLQKAENAARESQIEAALERVRGKAMAMRSSEDLNATANMVFIELRKLGVDLVRCGVGLMEKQDRITTIHAATNSDEEGNLEVLGKINMDIHPVFVGIYNHWQHNKDYFPILEEESLKVYYEKLHESGIAVPEWKSGERQYGYFFPFADGCLYAWSGEQESEATIKTLKRFTSVIGLTYTRYMELQKAEINAREAIREASLDRVRAEIASMRTTADLERITPLVWNELTILGIPFIRCGVFIIDEQDELIHTYLSTPDGKALAAFNLAFDSEGIGQNVLPAWRKKQTATVHWTAEEFAEYTKNLVEQGAVKSKERYVTEHPDTSLDLHFLPFLQGMLYVGNITPLSDDEMDVVGSLAEAFSTAYARYEDFNKLEAAKQQVENTLTDLKATQTKLIQSEKMASLGELTAGIAHEIQNPLNFVNNFSEVNQEMIDELEEELRAGNIEEALAIAADIKQNEEKISHHGKRADGIVKGMLQHSRSGGGEKQPTDMNALADEFFRLSYHGLRAKDKVFNAEMVTHFDANLPKINVIPQDMGRVMLNLFNNAFYAVNQKKKDEGADYKPEVAVTTLTENGQVIIKVRDNGVGMSEHIKEKIMQPFFTTKPTGEGTGLGLSLTYDMVVKGNGGTINVETKEGEFTEFVVTLPI